MWKKHKKLFIILGSILLVVILCVVTVVIVRSRRLGQSSYQTEVIARGDLTALVGATGTVRANQTARLVWQTGGRIGEILVSTGDIVQSGEVLAILATDSLSQSVILAQADLVTAQRNLENLINSNLATALAQQNLANAEDQLNEAKGRITSTSWQRGSQDQIDSANAQLILAQQARDQAQSVFNAVSNLPADNPSYAFALSNLAAAQHKVDTAQANLDWLQGKWNTTEVAVNAANLAVAQARYDDALREWNRLKDGPDPVDVQAAQARVNALEAAIGMASLKAPFAGTVTDVASLIGDQVSIGTASFRIDDLSRLLVDVEVPEIDINRIQVGQNVTISFDAISGITYNGEVIEVARAGEVVQGVVNFDLTIHLLDADDQVLPGMTAAVNIITEQLTDVLLVPNRAIRVRDGKMVVYLLQDGQATAVEVEVGASSDTYSQVLAGEIAVDDIVVLNPPLEISSQGPGTFMR